MKTRPTFHHANLKSPRLQKLLKFLKRVGKAGATTMQICIACDSTRGASDISELSACGINIQTEYRGTNSNGRRIYAYRLT